MCKSQRLTDNPNLCIQRRVANCNRLPPSDQELATIPTPPSRKRKVHSDDSGQQKKVFKFEFECPSKFRTRASDNAEVEWMAVQKKKKVCSYWLGGYCKFGDNCRWFHPWSLGCCSLLIELQGHQNSVTGIALETGSDKLCTGSDDGTVRIWNFRSARCENITNVGGSVGCLTIEGSWIFIGLPNLVKAWNLQTSVDQSLTGAAGQVHAIAESNGLLFAGAQDGAVTAWKFDSAAECFESAAAVAILKGHDAAVVSLVVGSNMLYSGSRDNTIRQWSLETLQCVQVLRGGHGSAVTGLICWSEFLLSCSSEGTINVWGNATEKGDLEAIYTHSEGEEEEEEGYGVVTFCGMRDLSGKPILLCSCSDSCVRVYELPSFSLRGKILGECQVRVICAAAVEGGNGVFFTGDGSGNLKAWKLID